MNLQYLLIIFKSVYTAGSNDRDNLLSVYSTESGSSCNKNMTVKKKKLNDKNCNSPDDYSLFDKESDKKNARIFSKLKNFLKINKKKNECLKNFNDEQSLSDVQNEHGIQKEDLTQSINTLKSFHSKDPLFDLYDVPLYYASLTSDFPKYKFCVSLKEKYVFFARLLECLSATEIEFNSGNKNDANTATKILRKSKNSYNFNSLGEFSDFNYLLESADKADNSKNITKFIRFFLNSDKKRFCVRRKAQTYGFESIISIFNIKECNNTKNIVTQPKIAGYDNESHYKNVEKEIYLKNEDNTKMIFCETRNFIELPEILIVHYYGRLKIQDRSILLGPIKQIEHASDRWFLRSIIGIKKQGTIQKFLSKYFLCNLAKNNVRYTSMAVRKDFILTILSGEHKIEEVRKKYEEFFLFYVKQT